MSGGEVLSGGWFASVAIDKFVDRAIGYLGGNHALHKGTAEMLDNLKTNLPQMQAIMEEAAKQQIHNEGLIKWLKSIKDAAYEAEDVLDDFEKKRISEDLMGKGMVSKAVSSIVKTGKNFILVDSDVENLNKIVEKIDQICKKSNTFVGLLELDRDHKGKGPANTESANNTPILHHNPKLFCRDNEIKLILSMIMGYEIELSDLGRSSQDGNSEAGPSNAANDGSAKGAGSKSFQEQGIREDLQSKSGHYGRPHIIPIVGICGVGKTALAQIIYNHQLLKNRFHLKKWFYVSQQSNVNKILKAFVPSFDSSDPSDLTNKLVKEIKGKRYLLVLDDVSSDICSKLEDVLPWFNAGAYGSVILVTTREHKVSNTLGTVSPIMLNPLDWVCFLPLLEFYAFKNSNIEKKQALKLVCWNIGRLLHGIPQAAQIIGKMLRVKMEVKHWENILHKLKCPGNNNAFAFLEIAYRNLDTNLKQCLAFCSTFPPNYIIEKERIIQLWIANNFIQLNSGDETRSEITGDMWFDELVSMLFFLPTPWPHKYIMNRAARELAKAVFSNEAFVFDDNPNPCHYGCFLEKENISMCSHGYSVADSGPGDIPPSTRYLTVNTKKPSIDLKACSDKLRTLLFHSDCFELTNTAKRKRGIITLEPLSRITKKNSFLHSTSKLRVLELSYPHGVERHLKAISELFHLRILDLSFTGIKEFPESLCGLFHLQVLDIRGCEFEVLPKNMNYLINLRHLYASKETISLISGIGKLTNLQELEEFRITKKNGHKISELAQMKEIGGNLSIVGLENVEHEIEAGEARLKEKTYLEVLSLRWVMNLENITPEHKENANKILYSLQPHSAIKEWEIKDYPGIELPLWRVDPSILNFRSIHLENCHYVEDLPPLGLLPFLETLVFKGLTLTHIGEELYGSREVIFPALKILKFVGMKKWEVWSPSGERELLPRLEELEIRVCEKLKETPLRSLKLPYLKKLELSRCKGVSLINQKLPLLNLLCISDNAYNIILANLNAPNLRFLSLKMIDATFTKHSYLVDWFGVRDLSSLTKLAIWIRYEILENIIKLSFPSLRILEIRAYGFGTLKRLHMFIQKLPHLTELTLYLEGVPDDYASFSFATLTSLKSLRIHFEGLIEYISCSIAVMLPEMPPNLMELYIMNMPKALMQHCIPEQGEDWSKIAHIPYIRINGKTLQMF